jgi:hypothetical protein
VTVVGCSQLAARIGEPERNRAFLMTAAGGARRRWRPWRSLTPEASAI